MEHAAAIDVPGMEAAGISLEDYVYYHCRVRLASLPELVPSLQQRLLITSWLPDSLMRCQHNCSPSDMKLQLHKVYIQAGFAIMMFVQLQGWQADIETRRPGALGDQKCCAVYAGHGVHGQLQVQGGRREKRAPCGVPLCYPGQSAKAATHTSPRIAHIVLADPSCLGHTAYTVSCSMRQKFI